MIYLLEATKGLYWVNARYVTFLRQIFIAAQKISRWFFYVSLARGKDRSLAGQRSFANRTTVAPLTEHPIEMRSHERKVYLFPRVEAPLFLAAGRRAKINVSAKFAFVTVRFLTDIDPTYILLITWALFFLHYMTINWWSMYEQWLIKINNFQTRCNNKRLDKDDVWW